MSFAAKVVITIVVCFFLVALGAVGLGVYLWSRHSGALMEAGKRQAEQGYVFGRDTDESGCLDEAIRRYKGNRGFAGSMGTAMWVQACWKTSRPTAGFCDRVPSPFDVLRSGRWQTEQAKKAGLNDPFGPSVFGQVEAYCDAKSRQQATPVTPR